MSKGYKSRNKRVSRHELIQSVKKLQRMAIDQEERADRAEKDAERTRNRIREIGFKCVDPLYGGELEHKTIVPTPYGTYCVIADDGQRDIGTIVEYAKQDLAIKVANMLIDENLVEFIIHRKGEAMPLLNTFCKETTVGVKLYVVPWEKMVVWKDGVTVGNIREWQYGRHEW